MFALFMSLYISMFSGHWDLITINDTKDLLESLINKLGEVLTSLFSGTTTPVTDLGDVFFGTLGIYPAWMALVSFILALITSIGIVVMAVKGVKKAFGIFFMGIRR